MQNDRQVFLQSRIGKKTGIWLSLLIALGLHAIILFLPISRQMPVPADVAAKIELHLTTYSPPPRPQPPLQSVPEPLLENIPEPAALVSNEPLATQRLQLKSTPQVRDLQHDLENMSEQQKRYLTNSILTRQFISEESAADQLFGKPIAQYNFEPVKEFHYPYRQNMMTILDPPEPDLPFEYTPGLIRFAYEPGSRGDLQRFWDVITPEFGWRTKNGTEFKCVWVLIIAACGWK